jgi:S1-C subfamily serine protease
MTPAGRHTSVRGWTVLATAVVVGLLAIGGCSVTRTGSIFAPRPSAQGPIQAVPQDNSSTGPNQSADAQSIADKVDPAVVDVNTVIDSSGQQAQAAGTGMIVTSSGEVLTNHHVVAGASRIQVTVQGRSNSYAATLIGEDLSADVALLQIHNVSGLPTVSLADSSNLTVGQAVIAIGNALGQGGTPNVTQGTITALGQSITASDGNGTSEQLTGLIQSNAPISRGDSGGPLVNTAGQVVGMITAGSAGGFRQVASRVGFAVPSNTALDVVNQIRSGHPSSSSVVIGQAGFLGVGASDLDPATASRLGLSVSAGALVQSVVSGSPAAQAGIPQNAVIVAINGHTVTSTADLGVAIHTHKPGERIQVTWVDRNGRHTATVTLMSGPTA